MKNSNQKFEGEANSMQGASRGSGDPAALPAEGERDEYDVVIIGSGFGGSVSALRLTEKGYRVAVLEAGRRFSDDALPKNSWHLRSFLWAPAIGCLGILRMSLLKDAFILSGAGVGGGSLGYAQTLYEPNAQFYVDPQWAHITEWRPELAPYFDLAKRMLGVTANSMITQSDEVLRDIANEMGVGHTFRMAEVGVFFGEPGVEAGDPYFGGAGPRRRGCTGCGECLSGCRHNAKNTLVKNYLYLAERGGARVCPLTTVTRVRQMQDGRYAVETVRSGSVVRRGRRTFLARDVIFSAATLGTQKLLLRMRDEGHLPRLSSRLGELTRTNSEAILTARTFRRDVDFSKGVAVSSSIYPDEFTHIEAVRYGRGSNVMGALTTALADADRGPRPLTWAIEYAKNIGSMLRNLVPRHWSEQTIIALVMQARNNSITCYTKRGLFGRHLTTKQGAGEPAPVWIPMAHQAVRRIAKRIRGVAFGCWNDVFNIPMTAHLLGGCVIGDSAETGVIDAYHRVYGHPGLHVVCGAAVTANPGVNPALTITAMSERAMAFWPNKGEADQRPPVTAPYVRLNLIAPRAPLVPAGAPGELRLS
ncbi:MAG: FAD-dependent oxidoreductase [Candidatus Acidiferrales bacterium]